MSESEILERANALASLYGLHAEFLPNVQSVGVQGDGRSYTPVLCLIGPFPGYEKVAELSNKITNTLPINRVALQIAPVQ